MAPHDLSSAPEAPTAAPLAIAPSVRDAKAEFLAIMQNNATPGITIAADKIGSALAIAQNDMLRTAMRAELIANAGGLREFIEMWDDEWLVAQVEKILAQTARTNLAVSEGDNIQRNIQRIEREDHLTNESTKELNNSLAERNNNTRELIAKFASHKRIAQSPLYRKEDVDRIGEIKDNDIREREILQLQAEIILNDKAIQEEARANFKTDAEFQASLWSLQAMFPDIPTSLPPVRPKSLTKYEEEFARRLGANPDMIAKRQGTQIIIPTNERDQNGKTIHMIVDVSIDPPRMSRQSPNGFRMPLGLNGLHLHDWSRRLDGVIGAAKSNLDALHVKQEKRVESSVTAAKSLEIELDDQRRTPTQTLTELLRITQERANDVRADKGPENNPLDESVSPESMVDAGLDAVRAAQAPDSQDLLRQYDRMIAYLTAGLEEATKTEEQIRVKEKELSDLETEKDRADGMFDDSTHEKIDTAKKNEEVRESLGIAELDPIWTTKLVEMANRTEVKFSIPDSEAIDLSKPLTSKDQKYLASLMDKLVGPDSKFWEEGILLPGKQEELRKRLIERGILDLSGQVRTFNMELALQDWLEGEDKKEEE